MTMKPYATVGEYLDDFSGETRQKLDAIRNVIKELVPDAQEKISYGIPTTTLNDKYLVYFAGYTKHISVYPIPAAESDTLRKGIEKYRAGKGTLKFSLDKPLPLDFIKDIVLAHVDRLQS